MKPKILVLPQPQEANSGILLENVKILKFHIICCGDFHPGAKTRERVEIVAKEQQQQPLQSNNFYHYVFAGVVMFIGLGIINNSKSNRSLSHEYERIPDLEDPEQNDFKLQHTTYSYL